ncbi:MAG: hypothetical protein WBD87_14995 [Candidatus Acidiferrales bacterium]
MKREAHAPKLSITSIATRNACPICLALREFQTDLVKHLKPEGCQRFCNIHGWVVANSAPAESVVTIFLRAIENPQWRPAAPVSEQCDLCKKLHEEKERRLEEVAGQLHDPKLRSWLHDYGMLCSRHAHEVMTKLPESLQKSIQELITRNREEIMGILEDYLQRVKTGSHVGGGILGRAAEFLVAYRGIES